MRKISGDASVSWTMTVKGCPCDECEQSREESPDRAGGDLDYHDHEWVLWGGGYYIPAQTQGDPDSCYPEEGEVSLESLISDEFGELTRKQFKAQFGAKQLEEAEYHFENEAVISDEAW